MRSVVFVGVDKQGVFEGDRFVPEGVWDVGERTGRTWYNIEFREGEDKEGGY